MGNAPGDQLGVVALRLPFPGEVIEADSASVVISAEGVAFTRPDGRRGMVTTGGLLIEDAPAAGDTPDQPAPPGLIAELNAVRGELRRITGERDALAARLASEVHVAEVPVGEPAGEPVGEPVGESAAQVQDPDPGVAVVSVAQPYDGE
jgi:hypothetical protein